MLHPGEILNKIDEYLTEIDEIINRKIIGPKDTVDFVNEVKRLEMSFTAYIGYALPDSETKLEKYEDVLQSEIGLGFPLELFYKKKLQVMKDHLLIFKEEVQQRKKEYEILYRKEMTELETGRREAVVKEKEAGATIEILDILRGELKHRKKIEEDVSEIKKQLKDIKKKLN
jgi:hypothetical protein